MRPACDSVDLRHSLSLHAAARDLSELGVHPFFCCCASLVTCRSSLSLNRGPAGWYVLTRTPPGVLRVSTRVRPRGGTPFSNSRFPLPSTSGNTQMRYSSTRSAAISVCSNWLLPQICNADPSDALSWRTSSTTSPLIGCDFSQSKRSRLRVTTYFVALLNAFAMGLSPWFGQ